MDEVTTGLAKIAKGAIILGIATAIGKLASILSRIILARTLGPQDYGAYTMIITIASIGAVLATLGIGQGVPRFIGYYKEKPEQQKKIAGTAIVLTAIIGTIASLLVYIYAKEISTLLLHNLDYTKSIQTSAILILLMSLHQTTSAIAQGLENARAVATRSNIGIPVGILAIASIAALTGMDLTGIVIGLALAYLLIILSYSPIITSSIKIQPDPAITRELLIFSAPLAITSILGLVMTWTDTLMLGYYQGSQAVGIYNVAVPIAKQLGMFLTFMAFIYGPFCASLYAKNKIQEIKRIYQVLSRWTFILALPLFVVMFVFPEATINILLGQEYIEAATPLRLLSIAFITNIIMGLSRYTLIVIGDTVSILIATLAGSIVNIALNLTLIPLYNLTGAATATAISLILTNIVYSARLYATKKIHPFTRTYIKSVLAGLLALGVLMWLSSITTVDLISAGIMVLIFLGVYAILLVILKTLDKEDKTLLRAIEKKFGIKIPEIIVRLAR